MTASPAPGASAALAVSAPIRGAATLPAVRPPGPVELPQVLDQTLANGVRVLAVRRPGVPVVEMRLRVPALCGRPGEQAGPDTAARALLAETILTGTAERDRQRIATDLQSIGGSLGASSDADRLALTGSALADGLAELLRLLAEVLVAAGYPDDEVDGERDRVEQEITIARSQPAVLAREALLGRLHPGHPYGMELPPPGAVSEVTATRMREIHARRVSPDGALLTLVGDLDPAEAFGLAGEVLGAWTGRGGQQVPEVPAYPAGPLVLVNRPGAVQTNIRLGGAALPRSDERYPALQLANIVYGGYFSARLVNNIREDKGYTYAPRSSVDHAVATSRFTVAADVATEVTAPALLEMCYELGRMSVLPVSVEELDAARQYAVGTMALMSATSAGLASVLSVLVGSGLPVDYLREHPAALGRVSAEDVLVAGSQVLAPAKLAPVLLGDADRVRAGLEVLGPVQVAKQSPATEGGQE
ncbi:MAG: M16 family metallopeptidase [Frankiaceae bacterium]